MNGNAVMYDIGKHSHASAARRPTQNTNARTTSAFVIDINSGATVTPQVALDGLPPPFANSVVLPDGKVLVRRRPGLSRCSSQTTRLGADPRAVGPRHRDLHQAGADGEYAAHLPQRGPPAARRPGLHRRRRALRRRCTTNHADGEIFTPPYLLNPDGSPGPRPSITPAPALAARRRRRSTSRTDKAVTRFSLVG